MTALNIMLGLVVLASAFFLIDALRIGAEQRRMDRGESRNCHVRRNRK